MENTWVSRDLSVLEATVALVEDPDLWSEIVDMAACSGLAVEDVAGSPQVIEGEYVDMPDRLVLARRSGGHE